MSTACLRHGLHGDQAHDRPCHRLGHRLHVRCVSLSPLHIGFQVGGGICRASWPRTALSRAVLGRGSDLNPDKAGRKFPKETRHLSARRGPRKTSPRPQPHRGPGTRLCQIQPKPATFCIFRSIDVTSLDAASATLVGWRSSTPSSQGDDRRTLICAPVFMRCHLGVKSCNLQPCRQRSKID